MFHMHKGSGYVRDVFRTRNMRDLSGTVGIGHCRYPTAGSAVSELESQPFYVNSPFGITLAHNGNLTNSEALKRELFQLDFRHVNTNSDSEVLLNVLALELERAAQHARLDAERDLQRGRRRAPALPRRLRDRGDDRRLRHARVPRSLRHPAADHRRQRGDGRAPSTSSPASRWRSRRSASRCCATSSRARRSSSTRPARSTPPVRRESVAAPLHLRVRLPGAARLGDRRHVGLRDAAADGRASSRARSRGIPEAQDIDVVIPIPDSSRPSALRARQQPGPQVPRGLRQEPLHRPHVHHAGPGDAARRACARSSTPAASSSRTRSCCWSTTRSSAARRRARSCRWRARPARARSTSRRRARRCAIQNVYGIDMPNQQRAGRHRARTRPRSRARSAPTSSSTRSSRR